MRSETVALVFAVSLLMFGCNKGREGEGTAAESEGAIGVAECDAYVKKMEAFLDSLPEEARAAREPGFKAMRQAWRDAAQAPGGKEGLAATCKENLANVPSK
ncbi:hypothetical protein [Polyangium jinanense]|uniref:Lipoprotein n=1 Tax=Polyangium jinanense TaxID=2829994 RepID=A0A9X3WYG6_9BACT|nr:hypothetical protein [Polyangium jinanense]MDC3953816.1 hypothetical protein [Polyangium jinanense]MDC3979063.1 hypothetical protein [Polyangium jinanense]